VGRKLLDSNYKKERINITVPGWILKYIDDNRGETPRATFISYLLEEIIKLRQIK
jgi:hypothetical protein